MRARSITMLAAFAFALISIWAWLSINNVRSVGAWREGAVLHLRGDLDRHLLERLGNIDLDGITSVEVSSRGGEEVIAIEIAKRLEGRSLVLTINEDCIGPCALYLTAIAARTILTEQGTLACGANAIAAALAPAEAYSESTLPEEFLLTSQAGRDVLSRNGVAIGYALNCHVQLTPLRYEMVGAEPGVSSVRELWTPSARDLQGFGVRVSFGDAHALADVRDEAFAEDFLADHIPTLAQRCPASVLHEPISVMRRSY